ncbi:MAG: hypothetical protein EOM12_05755 [Verrucomicrobiae bacterium]|nr:hypothetical protein [Verrucomicrobiae bacterium]
MFEVCMSNEMPRGRKRRGGLFKRGPHGEYFPAHSKETGVYWLRYKANGKGVRLCLHTEDYTEADRLRAEHMGFTGTARNRREYLTSLVRIGKLAEMELNEIEDAKSIPVEKTWDTFLQSKRRPASGPGTLAAYCSQWNKLAGWLAEQNISDLEHVTPQVAERFVAHLDDSGYKAVTRCLNFYKLLWKALSLSNEPWNGLRSTARHVRVPYRRLTGTECRSIYENATGELQAVTTLSYYTALRAKDCCLLRREDVALDDELLRIVPGKTSAHKAAALVIPILPPLRAVLNGFYVSGEVYMFPALAKAYTRDQSQFSKSVRKLFAAAQVFDTAAGKASFHSYRATFISLMDEGGANPHITDMITGHAAQSMHDRYTQIDVEVARAAMLKALPPLT